MVYDILIVGGGPAGLCAAVYAGRKRLNTLLASLDIGGQPNTTSGIENYLGYQFIEGPELMEKFYAQVKQFPVEQKIGQKITRIDNQKNMFEATSDSGEKYKARTAIIATGKKPRRLAIPGESEYLGRGVSYCGICDGPVFAGKKVAVMGGGNSAATTALDMAKIAEHVNLISTTPLTADPLFIEKLQAFGNVNIIIRHQATRIQGNEFVRGITIRDLDSKQEKTLDLEGVFVEIGLIPNSELISHLVKLNKLGEVPISCYCETTMPGLFAAGDVTDVSDKQIIIAAGEGAKAALQAHRYLQELET